MRRRRPAMGAAVVAAPTAAPICSVTGASVAGHLDVLHRVAAALGRVAGDPAGQALLDPDRRDRGQDLRAGRLRVGDHTGPAGGTGGVSPLDASSGVPGSTTRATRFLPVSAGVLPQIASKSPAARGTRGLAPPTAYRQPSTAPSAGTTPSEPFWAKAHWPARPLVVAPEAVAVLGLCGGGDGPRQQETRQQAENQSSGGSEVCSHLVSSIGRGRGGPDRQEVPACEHGRVDSGRRPGSTRGPGG